MVDLRTGNSFPQEGRHRQAENEAPDIECTVQQEGRRILRQQYSNTSAKGDYHNCQSPVPAWLEQALDVCHTLYKFCYVSADCILQSNQAYAIVENRIPSVEVPPVSRHNLSGYNSFLGDKHGRYAPQNPVAHERLRAESFAPIYGSSSQEFTRDDIRHAEVINQVDRKFIACRIPKRSSSATSPYANGDGVSEMDSVVVLIDQHAADERVRVERFLKELFLGFLYSQERTGSNQSAGVRTKELNPPLPVLLTQHEALTLERSQDAREMLRKWGLEFAELSTQSSGMPDSDGVSGPGRSTGYAQVLVNSIPEVVSDKVCSLGRCFVCPIVRVDVGSRIERQLLQGDELRDLIKGFLGQIQSGELFSDAGLVLPSEEDQDNFFWFKAVRHCPRGLLELVNSKACRGKCFDCRRV